MLLLRDLLAGDWFVRHLSRPEPGQVPSVLAQPGDDCGASEVTFDVSDGAVLTCKPVGVAPISGGADFPGFTRTQNEKVTALARLGAGGLSAADQQRIQQLVDQYAATVPASRRPDCDKGFSFLPLCGTRLALAGGGALAVAGGLLLGGMLFSARAGRRRR